MLIKFDICPVCCCELFLNSHMYVSERQFIYLVSVITTYVIDFVVSHTIVMVCACD
jgi:hypothetical protein